MSQPCATSKCERTSRAPCDCCKQNLCLEHLYEHNSLLVAQLNPLTDEINAISDRFNRLNIHETVHDCREKLEEWRLDCHQKIDCFFEQKCQELDRLIAAKIDEEREKILHIKTKLVKLTREQEATRQDIDTLTSSIRNLGKAMNKIEQERFQVNIRPLSVDDTIIQFKEIYVHEFDPSTLSSVYKTIVYPKGSYRALATNNQSLLIHQVPNLCLVDTELTIVKQVLWLYEPIRDICWSTILDRFIVVCKDNIFLVNEKTMSIDSVSTVEKRSWSSCTCFSTQLFLSTNAWGASIMEITLCPSIAIIKEWKSPRTCTMNECIDDIVYHNETLAVVIRNKVEQTVRMELRCCKTLDCLWSLLLDVIYDVNLAFRCCSLDLHGWLVADHNTKHLLHITTDGKMKQTIIYKEIPYRITLFSSNMLAIATENCINFHQM